MSIIVFMLSLIALGIVFVVGFVLGYDKCFEDGRKNRKRYMK